VILKGEDTKSFRSQKRSSKIPSKCVLGFSLYT